MSSRVESSEPGQRNELSVTPVNVLPEPPNDSMVGTPPRRRNSIRRTSHINMTWPNGYGTPLQLRGRARDLLTGPTGTPEVLEEVELSVEIGDQRTVQAISATPRREGCQALVGARGGESFAPPLTAPYPASVRRAPLCTSCSMTSQGPR